MIELLFDGRISPAARDYGKDETYTQALQETGTAEAALRVQLSADLRPLLDAYIDASNQLSWRSSELDFREGFAIAAGFALELHGYFKSDCP